MRSPGADHGPGRTRGAAERILAELHERVRRRFPEWARRGPEDPGWALLEAFAEALAEVKADVDGLEDRLTPRLLERLGEEPRWATAASGAVAFRAREGVEEGVRVPRGTPVMTVRKSDQPGQVFETRDDSWYSATRLLRVTAVTGDRLMELFPYPESGWDSGPVALFSSDVRLARYLYLGDPVLHLLRERPVRLVLQWSGVPTAVVEGRWEVSVPGGWRMLPVEPEEE